MVSSFGEGIRLTAPCSEPTAERIAECLDGMDSCPGMLLAVSWEHE
jgi:hypothetical protein